MDDALTLIVVVVFIYIILMASHGCLKSLPSVILLVVSMFGVRCLSANSSDATKRDVSNAFNAIKTTGKNVYNSFKKMYSDKYQHKSNNAEQFDNYESDRLYDPVAEKYNTSSNALNMLNSNDHDFDDYATKGYIPGYSDIYLYNKDGSNASANLHRNATEYGTLKWGVKPKSDEDDKYNNIDDVDNIDLTIIPDLNNTIYSSRADNRAANLSSSMQNRSKERILNVSQNNRQDLEKWFVDGFAYNDDKRVWWEQD